MSGKLQEKTIGELTVTVKADVQDALKGIKVLNGELELRETTQILKQDESIDIEVMRANAQETA